MIYGYARVSTQGQDLQGQMDQLKNAGCVEIYSEKFTGTKANRQEFQRLLQIMGEGDTLIVTKLDRFARSAIDGITIIKQLFERGIKVHVLNMGIIEDTPTGRLILNIFLAFAEFERDLIIERTREGKENAKLKGDFKEGRPRKFKKAQIGQALKLLESHSYKQVEDMMGISKSTLIRAKRAHNTNK
ncbi:recombinase family protein [Neobacillus niacini]|uniref:recombinase family protein n=1 Tax=Neobacillus niacini TaxID=86668 RepID=UPI0030027688